MTNVSKILRETERTHSLNPTTGSTQELPEGVAKWKEELGKLPRHGAIMHLFLAIDAEGLDLSHIEDPAHLVVQDWGRSLQDSQNLCSFFIPSLLDKTLCPEGKHVIHVYSSGGEPYEPWEKLEPGSPEYEAYKEERADVLWKAVEKCIPDVRDRLEFSIIGSPLAHEAFLRRDRGTYGMAWAAGTSAPHAGLLKSILPFPFPNLKTPGKCSNCLLCLFAFATVLLIFSTSQSTTFCDVATLASRVSEPQVRQLRELSQLTL
jgi:hypothetical protein